MWMVVSGLASHGPEMERSITDYHLDDRGDWVAELDCGHGQHVRHNPPFTVRQWVTTHEGRQSKLGMLLNCVRCDRRELPDALECYKQTPVFTHDSVPKGLLKDHSTKTGTWGRINVTSGQLCYRVGDQEEILDPGHAGIVVPNQLHSVLPIGEVSFFVEFLRVANQR